MLYITQLLEHVPHYYTNTILNLIFIKTDERNQHSYLSGTSKPHFLYTQ